jgi:hypothetical protein
MALSELGRLLMLLNALLKKMGVSNIKVRIAKP